MENWKLKPARDIQLVHGARHRSTFREAGLLETGTRWVWWSFVRSYLKLYHGLSITGRERLPLQPPFVVVANHSSHLDALTLGSSMPMRYGNQTFPLAAGDVFFENSAAAAFSAYAINALPIWRKKHGKQALVDLRERLIEDQCIFILFPEGTRRRGDQMTKFRAGFGMFVAETQVPVVPAWIKGAYQAMPPKSRVPRPSRIEVQFGAPQTFSDVPNKRAGWNLIATALEKAVADLGRSMHDPAAPPFESETSQSETSE